MAEGELARERAKAALDSAEAKRAQFEAQSLKLQLERKSKIQSAEIQVQKESSRPSTYRVLPGETLQSISEKIYGSSDRWQDIYNANRNNIRRGTVEPGQVLVIP